MAVQCTSLWLLVSLLLTAFSSLCQAASPASVTYVHSLTSLNNLTLSLNVPQNSSDNLFFHFTAGASYGWTAFGFGNQMSGSLMFVAYPSADGKNVTVSPRLASGHSMPTHTSSVTIQLFEGSGITNQLLTVNAMCSGCRSWSGGSLDITSTQEGMLWAVGPGTNIKSDDLAATINQHSNYGQFSMDLTKATGLGGVPSTDTSLDNTTSTGSASSSDSGGSPFSAGTAVHALLMIAAFLIIFPGGYLFLRVFEKVWLHWGIQSFGAFFVVLGAGAGIYVSKKHQIHPKIDTPHQIIGLLILGLVLATWTLGMVGHQMFKKTGTPANVMLGHRVLGPLTVGLGLINACVGFNLAGRKGPIIGFIILVVIMIIIVGGSVYWKRRRQVRKQAMNTPAAMNFRHGQEAGFEQHGSAQAVGHGIPLQNYGDQPPMYK